MLVITLELILIKVLNLDEHKKSFFHLVRANEFANWMKRSYMKYAILAMSLVLLFDIVECISISLITDGYINEKYFIYPAQYR